MRRRCLLTSIPSDRSRAPVFKLRRSVKSCVLSGPTPIASAQIYSDCKESSALVCITSRRACCRRSTSPRVTFWTTTSEFVACKPPAETDRGSCRVMKTLETLKREAAEVTRKVDETDIVMSEVDQVTREYLPLAQAASSMFFVLDEMHLLHHFYQFSLRFFLDIFDFVLLHNPSLQGVTDPHIRLGILLNDLFVHLFKRTSRALLHSDHLTLAMLLAQIKLRGSKVDIDEQEFAFLLEGGDNGATDAPMTSSPLLDVPQRRRLQAFNRLTSFDDVQRHLESHQDEWRGFFAYTSPETAVPTIWTDLSRES